MRNMKATTCKKCGLGKAYNTYAKAPPGEIPSKHPYINDNSLQNTQNDWWDEFEKAVEDPETDIYEFIKNSLKKELEISSENESHFSGYIKAARQKAARELLKLKTPDELRKKVKALEKNTLLFPYNVRVGIKTVRVLIDTYISTQTDLYKVENRHNSTYLHENTKQDQLDKGLERTLSSQSSALQIKDIAHAMDNKKSTIQIKETIKDAAKQIAEDENQRLIAFDTLKFTKKYFKLDNVLNIAAHILPLVTWKYRWAVAACVGVLTARMSLYYGAKSVVNILGKNHDLAKENTSRALDALKKAGGNILIVGFSPLVGKAPKLLIGFTNIGIDYVYNNFIKTLKSKIRSASSENSNQKGNILAKTSRWLKNIYHDCGDGLIQNLSKVLKEKIPHIITQTAPAVLKKVPFSRLIMHAGKVFSLGKAALIRYARKLHNNLPPAQQRRINEYKRKIAGLRDDFNDLAREFRLSESTGHTEQAPLSDASAASNDSPDKLCLCDCFRNEKNEISKSNERGSLPGGAMIIPPPGAISEFKL
jgi:hypothetical protein